MPRPRRTAAIGAALAALALAAPAGASAAGDCPDADLQPTADNLAQIGQATLCLLNAERTSHGLGALAENPTLSRASLAYSQQMVAQSFFAHEAPDGTGLVDRLTAVGYLKNDGGDWAVGENIAWAQGSLSTPRAVMQAWMDSPGHRDNILSGDYVEIGVGVAPGIPEAGQQGTTFTTDFGMHRVAPASAAPTPRKPRPSARKKPRATPRKPARTRARTASTHRARRAVWVAKLIG
jgi:uncharacterized protein YkwD